MHSHPDPVVCTHIPSPHDPVTWPLWGGSPGHHPGKGFSPTVWRRGLSAVGQQGLLRAYLDALSAVNQGKETTCGCQVLVCTIAGQIWESDQLNLSYPFCVSWHPCEYILHIHKELCLCTVFCSVGLFICFYTSTTSPWLPCNRCWNRPPSSFFKSFAVCSFNSSVTFTMFYSASTKIAIAVLIMS